MWLLYCNSGNQLKGSPNVTVKLTIAEITLQVAAV